MRHTIAFAASDAKFTKKSGCINTQIHYQYEVTLSPILSYFDNLYVRMQ